MQNSTKTPSGWEERYFRSFAERFKESQEALFEDIKVFIQETLEAERKTWNPCTNPNHTCTGKCLKK